MSSETMTEAEWNEWLASTRVDAAAWMVDQTEQTRLPRRNPATDRHRGMHRGHGWT